MDRVRILLLVAALTVACLQAWDRGAFHAAARSVGGLRAPNWQPAAEREVTDRPEDAFQRAWNSSETRVRKAMGREGEAP